MLAHNVCFLTPAVSDSGIKYLKMTSLMNVLATQGQSSILNPSPYYKKAVFAATTSGSLTAGVLEKKTHSLKSFLHSRRKTL